MASTISNGKNTPLNVKTGTVPDVSGAMQDWFQPMVFEHVTKTVDGFEVIETGEETSFQGVIQPLRNRDLLIKPEGERAWTWFMLHAEPSLTLNVDEVVLYLGVQTRVMARRDYTIYGYVYYELVQDWTGAGPTPEPDITLYDGGAAASVYDFNLDGGSATITGVPVDGGSASVS